MFKDPCISYVRPWRWNGYRTPNPLLLSNQSKINSKTWHVRLCNVLYPSWQTVVYMHVMSRESRVNRPHCLGAIVCRGRRLSGSITIG